jgi:hypothetical protein
VRAATYCKLAVPGVTGSTDPMLNVPSSANLMIDFRFDLAERVGTMLRGDPHELLAIELAALDFVKTAGGIPRPSDNRSACQNIVHERSWLGAVKQACARLGF